MRLIAALFAVALPLACIVFALSRRPRDASNVTSPVTADSPVEEGIITKEEDTVEDDLRWASSRPERPSSVIEDLPEPQRMLAGGLMTGSEAEMTAVSNADSTTEDRLVIFRRWIAHIKEADLPEAAREILAARLYGKLELAIALHHGEKIDRVKTHPNN